jgi:hypothetical protein
MENEKIQYACSDRGEIISYLASGMAWYTANQIEKQLIAREDILGIGFDTQELAQEYYRVHSMGCHVKDMSQNLILAIGLLKVTLKK